MGWWATWSAGISSAQRRTLIAAALGWMLDAFDAMLYALCWRTSCAISECRRLRADC